MENLKGDKMGTMDNESRLLGSYPIEDGFSVRVHDPDAVDWHNTDQVQKVEMDEEVYDTFKPSSVKPTVRDYKVNKRKIP